MIRRCLLSLLCLLPMWALAQAIQPLPFRDAAQEARFQRLSSELRCPMCQNETLADSNAPIAHDLRRQIFDMMQAGKSDDEIKAWLVQRYSRFILYQPPVQPSTWLLWFGPLAVLLVGAAVVAVQVRRRRQAADGALPVTAQGDDDW
jgi:cytochrome c-type biogenesis protein CcmH